ncbi:MAG: type II toxin-antitoxin system RelE/ParE family toxin [archaeon]
MKKFERINKVAFADLSLQKAFLGLQEGKHEDKQLAKFLQRAIDDLKKNPFCGIRIPSKLWPKEYVMKYGIDNLRKYNLPDSWRLIYTIRGNKLEIISVLIEWFNHKNYERKFKY